MIRWSLSKLNQANVRKKPTLKGSISLKLINKYRRNKMKAESARCKLSLMIFVLRYSSMTILTSERRSDVRFLTLIPWPNRYIEIFLAVLFFSFRLFLKLADHTNRWRKLIYIMSLLIARFYFLAGYKVKRGHNMLTVCNFMINLIYLYSVFNTQPILQRNPISAVW